MAGELEQAKRQLRGEMAARRRAVRPEPRSAAGRDAARHLQGCAAFRQAERVGLYADLADELPMRACFEAVVESGRQALLPRIEGERGLAFRAVARWEELVPGRYGVRQPAADGRVARLSSGDLVLVPGVAFDAAGHRLGRGGGYYDAAFPAGQGGPLLFGVAFEFQLVEAVPHGPRDRRVDALVTEERIRCITGVER